MTTPPEADDPQPAARAAGVLGTALGAVRSDRAKRVMWGSGGEVVQLGLSFLVFVLVAKRLGADGFGLYGAIVAHCTIVGAFTHVGAHALLFERVSAGRPFQDEWARTFTTVLLGTTAGAALLMALRPWLIPEVAPLTYLLHVVTWLNLFWMVEIGVHAATMRKRMAVGTAIRLVNAVARLGSLAVFVMIGGTTLETWGWFSAGGALIGFGAMLVLVDRELHLLPEIRLPTRQELRDGFPFALSFSSEGFLDASDRPILVANGFTEDAGRYFAGVRIVQLGYIPLIGIVRAADAEMFERGASAGTSSTMALARRLLLPAVGVSAVMSVGLLLCADLVPLIMGEAYRGSADVIRLLAVLPMLKACSYLAGNALMASGYQQLRFRLNVAAAALNLGLNLILIPHFSWKGAVATTLLAEVLLATALWVSGTLIARGEDRGTRELRRERRAAHALPVADDDVPEELSGRR